MAPFCACQQTFRHCFYVRPWARLGDSLSHWSCQSDIRASCKATANQQAPAVEDPPATFQALVGTKLFFGLGSWRTPTPKQLQRLSGFLTNLLKKVMRVTPERWSIHGTCSCRRGHCWNPGTVSTGPFALCTAPLFGWPFLFESSGAFGICMFSSFMVGMLEGRLAMGL